MSARRPLTNRSRGWIHIAVPNCPRVMCLQLNEPRRQGTRCCRRGGKRYGGMGGSVSLGEDCSEG